MWIARNGPIWQPARSLDLTSVTFLKGYMKDGEFCKSLHNISDLNRRNSQSIVGIVKGRLQKVFETLRVEFCSKFAKTDRFENFCN